MSKTPDLEVFDHHQPRKTDKKKRHARGFSEDVDVKRHSRISFKKYLEQVEEELAQEDDEEDDLT